MKNKNLASVIVTTKNSQVFLKECLRSIKKQAHPNIELIVVDNYSTDNTKKIAKEFTSYVYSQGPERSAQRNFGAKKARGEYVYFVDADFVLEKKVIEQCIEKIHQGFDAVAINNPPDPTISWIAKIRKFEVDMYEQDITHQAARFFKKSAFIDIGGYNENVVAGEDYDIQNRLNRKNYRTGFIKAKAIHLGEPNSLWIHMKKYFLYGKDFVNYTNDNKKESRQQLNFFRNVYLKNWQKFLRSPMIGGAFIGYHILKYAFGGAGYLVGKVGRKR